MLTKKYLGLILITISIIGCTTNPKLSTIYPIAENYNSPIYSNINSSILFNDLINNWQLVDTKYLNGTTTYIYIPNTETNYDWSEKIEIAYTRVTPLSNVMNYFTQIIKPEIKDQCYYENPNFRILQQSKNDLVFTYTMKNCGKYDDQEVMGRIMRAPNSISTITYSTKNNQLFAAEQDQILAFIKTAKIIKD
jgi:hypothetical protein